jgi:hypothetical protein
MKEISYIKWLYLEIILSLKSIIYYIKNIALKFYNY